MTQTIPLDLKKEIDNEEAVRLLHHLCSKLESDICYEHNKNFRALNMIKPGEKNDPPHYYEHNSIHGNVYFEKDSKKSISLVFCSKYDSRLDKTCSRINVTYEKNQSDDLCRLTNAIIEYFKSK